jgi:hypothetical protein
MEQQAMGAFDDHLLTFQGPDVHNTGLVGIGFPF